MTATCAPWCMTGPTCTGRECYYHPDDADLFLTHEPGNLVELAMGRAEDDHRTGLAEPDTCTVSLGLGEHGFGADRWVELTTAEVRQLAGRLTEFCDLADADRSPVAGEDQPTI